MTEASTGLVDEAGTSDVDDIDIAIDLDGEVDVTSTMTRAQRERMRRERKARNRRTELIAVCVALVVGAIAALSTSPRHAADHRPAVRTQSGAAAPGARPHTVLVVHYDRSRRIDVAALVGVDRGGHAGSFVFLPQPTVLDVPALELQPVGSLLRVGDHSLLVNVVENTTGVRVDQTVLLDDTTLARAFAAVRTLTIAFPHTVSISDRAGSLTFPGGPVRGVLPSQAVRLLVGHESGGSLAHLATVQAVLQAYFSALRASPAAARQAARVHGVTPFTALAGVTGMHYDVIPVTTDDAASGERFEVRQTELDELVRSDFGYARLGGSAPRPVLELLNGVGVAGLTQRVARIVVPAGGYVTLTGNVDHFGQQVTHVVYYDDSHYTTAVHFAHLLGFSAKAVVRGDITLASVDISVVIGRDFVKAHR